MQSTCGARSTNTLSRLAPRVSTRARTARFEKSPRTLMLDETVMFLHTLVLDETVMFLHTLLLAQFLVALPVLGR